MWRSLFHDGVFHEKGSCLKESLLRNNKQNPVFLVVKSAPLPFNQMRCLDHKLSDWFCLAENVIDGAELRVMLMHTLPTTKISKLEKANSKKCTF